LLEINIFFKVLAIITIHNLWLGVFLLERANWKNWRNCLKWASDARCRYTTNPQLLDINRRKLGLLSSIGIKHHKPFYALNTGSAAKFYSRLYW